jgi:hypothetical protein
MFFLGHPRKRVREARVIELVRETDRESFSGHPQMIPPGSAVLG